MVLVQPKKGTTVETLGKLRVLDDLDDVGRWEYHRGD